MGGIASIFWKTNPTLDNSNPHPVTGLTSLDLHLVKTSWNDIFQKNSTETGMTIFLQLFTKNTAYHQMFPFRNVPFEELRTNKRFQAHCNSLMYAFSAIIDHIEDAEMATELLLKQGESHKPRGVTTEAYWELHEVLINIFASLLPEQTLAAWKKALTFAFATIIEGGK